LCVETLRWNMLIIRIAGKNAYGSIDTDQQTSGPANGPTTRTTRTYNVFGVRTIASKQHYKYRHRAPFRSVHVSTGLRASCVGTLSFEDLRDENPYTRDYSRLSFVSRRTRFPPHRYHQFYNNLLRISPPNEWRNRPFCV